MIRSNGARRRILATIFSFVLAAMPSFGCSVLSHEALVDAAWEVKLKPLLAARFPNASPEDLKTAHGFAYGGAIIQDLGYYPHGSKQFSDLTHYVRTGDFVLALLREAQDLNELAFALGALSHYSSDIDVHRDATNPGEAILYPKLAKKYGSVVTYEENPGAHLKTEFGFDVLEIARGNYAPEAYHAFIGFNVATPVLERAFRDTYGLELKDIFDNFKGSVESYRHAVSKTIPQATRVAWAAREDEIEAAEPGMTQRRFVYVMKRSSYEKEWGKQYDRPSAGDRFLAGIVKLIPPVGPLRALRFKMPTPEVEKLFMRSFERALNEYEGQVDGVRAKALALPNKNYDLGEIAKPGVYRLQDKAFADWLDELARKNYGTVTPGIREAFLKTYSAGNADQSFTAELQQLKRVRNGPAKAPMSSAESP